MNRRPSDVRSREKDASLLKVKEELERLDRVTQARARAL
jgi:hypothetical protein